ncbi:MAG: hypothetical protein J5822_08110 [Eubacteriaceae bacterium]|nr:hypothetical protein [Eubacteriaceae bacterium]
MDRKDCFYASYPEGYDRLVKKIIPFWLRPAKDMLMRLLVTILKDG